MQIPIPALKRLTTHRIKKHNAMLTTLLVFGSASHNVSAKGVDVEIATTKINVETISVSGTRTSREINEIAASVTRITNDQIDAMAATNIRDILRYEPGVSVEGSGRYGLSNFNIRGINADRVLILLDGVPIADEFKAEAYC